MIDLHDFFQATCILVFAAAVLVLFGEAKRLRTRVGALEREIERLRGPTQKP